MATLPLQIDDLRSGITKRVQVGPLTYTGGVGDASTPISMPWYQHKTVQVTGTWGAGGAVVIEGSNDASTWFTLHQEESATTALTFSANCLTYIYEIPQHVRIRVTGGDGTTSLTAVFIITTFCEVE